MALDERAILRIAPVGSFFGSNVGLTDSLQDSQRPSKMFSPSQSDMFEALTTRHNRCPKDWARTVMQSIIEIFATPGCDIEDSRLMTFSGSSTV